VALIDITELNSFRGAEDGHGTTISSRMDLRTSSVTRTLVCFTSNYCSHCFTASLLRTAEWNSGTSQFDSFGRNKLVLVFCIILSVVT
jgi:hypothetical protein